MMQKRTLILGLTLIVGTALMAQRNKLVDKRDQAEGWYLPVHGQVLVDGKKNGDSKIQLFKDNELIGPVQMTKKGSFDLELDIDHTYTVMIMKDGFEDKLILIDTALPPDLVTYPDYECYANLIPSRSEKGVDQFYTDFPSAIVRWNEDMGGFYHSEQYLDDIQGKVAGIAQTTF